MPIETKIEGDPASIRAKAAWVRDSLASGVTDTADAIYQARNGADAGWSGDASDGFRTDMTHGARKAHDFGSRGKEEAQGLDDAAADLKRAQTDMERIRSEASAAGLTLNPTGIDDPSPAPAAPGPTPSGKAATPEAVGAHNDMVAAAQAHERQIRTYERLNGEANDVRRRWSEAVQNLNERSNNANKNAFFSITDVAANTTVAAAAGKHASIMHKQAQFHRETADKLLKHAKAMSATDARGIYQNLDDAAEHTKAASAATDDAAKAPKRGQSVGLKAGGALAGAGIVYDITQGKPVDQAVVSGGAGFAASAGTGMLAGAWAGPVGVGVGAIVGAGVGVFTSGAIDSLYENGIGAVGQAAKDGWNAVVDTGEAVVDAGEAVGDFVGDTWNAIF